MSAVRVTHEVLPHMRARRSGLIVTMSAAVGRFVLPFMTNYSAAKHAVEALAEGYRYELAPFGIDSVIVERAAFLTAGSRSGILRPPRPTGSSTTPSSTPRRRRCTTPARSSRTPARRATRRRSRTRSCGWSRPRPGSGRCAHLSGVRPHR